MKTYKLTARVEGFNQPAAMFSVEFESGQVEYVSTMSWHPGRAAYPPKVGDEVEVLFKRVRDKDEILLVRPLLNPASTLRLLDRINNIKSSLELMSKAISETIDKAYKLKSMATLDAAIDVSVKLEPVREALDKLTSSMAPPKPALFPEKDQLEYVIDEIQKSLNEAVNIKDRKLNKYERQELKDSIDRNLEKLYHPKSQSLRSGSTSLTDVINKSKKKASKPKMHSSKFSDHIPAGIVNEEYQCNMRDDCARHTKKKPKRKTQKKSYTGKKPYLGEC